MIIKKLSIHNMDSKTIIKTYEFKKYGLNVILGDKRSDDDDTNGVGKSSFVKQMHFLLGRDFSKENIPRVLLENSILTCLEIEINNSNIYLARLFTDQKHGYILQNQEFDYDLDGRWMRLKNKDYRESINDILNHSNESNVTFAALRDYIIRDEKKGFSSIVNTSYNRLQQYKTYISLFNLPSNFEESIQKITKTIEELEKEKKFISSYNQSSGKLEIKKQEILKEVQQLENQISKINLGEFTSSQADQYSRLKIQQSKLQSEIFKIRFNIKQYEKNIKNLETKGTELEKLDELEEFYKQINIYFPRDIKKNYQDIQEFYRLMKDDRGNFFTEQIKTAKLELQKLSKKNTEIEERLAECTSVLKETNFINDVTHIQRRLNLLQTELAEINVRIKGLEKINELNVQIQEEKLERSREIVKLHNKFKSFNEQVSQLNNIFSEIINKTYDDNSGYLTFSFDNSTKGSPGRIKIDCFIPEEDSYGRHNSKIRAIDLTWLIYRVRNELPIEFLVHDGSFSATDNHAAYKMLKFIHETLSKFKRGQYIVTLNRKDLTDEALEYFKANGLVIADLKKDKDENRFFGFKY